MSTDLPPIEPAPIMAHNLVTLVQAKSHLGITYPDGDPGDPNVQLKLDAAHELVLRWVSKAEAGRVNVAAWVDPDTTPADVKAAILLELGGLYRFRGDDLAGAGPPRDPESDLQPATIGLLRRFTDPVLR